MNFRNINPVPLKTIQNAFRVLKEDHWSKSGVSLIEEALQECFKDRFIVRVIPMNTSDSVFVMSIFPERNTMEKIIENVVSGKSSYEAIRSLWEKNTVWTIEIDEFILEKMEDVTERELTALLLHEIGHTVGSNSISKRIVTILQYEYAQTSMKNKLMLRDKIFRSILSLPVLNACVSDQKGSNLKEEIKADGFVKKLGYVQDLISVMRKIEKYAKHINSDPNEAMRTTTRFSLDTIDNIRNRRAQLVKEGLQAIEEGVRSVYLETYLVDLYGKWFVDRSKEDGNRTHVEYEMLEHKKENLLQGIMDRRMGSYMREFGIFGRKKMEKIEPYEIDYIDVKIDSMRSDTDKMMLISYLHNKLDTVQFYIDILNDPVESKRYSVPHSLSYLENVKKRLNGLRERILKYRVPTRTNDIIISYPSGYEG